MTTLRERHKIARLFVFHDIASVVNIPQNFFGQLGTLTTTIHFILSTQAKTPQHIKTATSQELSLIGTHYQPH